MLLIYPKKTWKISSKPSEEFGTRDTLRKSSPTSPSGQCSRMTAMMCQPNWETRKFSTTRTISSVPRPPLPCHRTRRSSESQVKLIHSLIPYPLKGPPASHLKNLAHFKIKILKMPDLKRESLLKMAHPQLTESTQGRSLKAHILIPKSM
jgi:hypothetical protein